MRLATRLACVASLVTMLSVASASLAGGAFADAVELVRPQSEQLTGSELFQAQGINQDQLPGYLVPGPVDNTEDVRVAVAPDGSVVSVVDQQRLTVTGEGDYVIRESGPARSARTSAAESPVLNLGDLIWQGYSTGRRELAANLSLDPQLETAHLPLGVKLSFRDRTGRAVPLTADGRVPGAGTLSLQLTNQTGTVMLVPAVGDAPAAPVAAALNLLTRAGAGTPGPTDNHPANTRLPTVNTGLPTSVPATDVRPARLRIAVPFRVSGRVQVQADAGAGGTTSTPGTPIDLLVSGSSTVAVAVTGPGRIRLDLAAVAALDPKTASPPAGFRSWPAWAASRPGLTQRRLAANRLLQLSAVGARASAYSPYLGSDFDQTGRTTFHYNLPLVPAAPAPAERLRPRPVPITVGALLMAALLATAAWVWRRS